MEPLILESFPFESVKPDLSEDFETRSEIASDDDDYTNASTMSSSLKTFFFKCDKCAYQTQVLSLLDRHKAKHELDRPFQCSVCDFSDFDHSTFVDHWVSHQQTRIIGCAFCSFKCSRPDSLKTHIVTHQPAKMLDCTMCEYSTCFVSLMKSHIEQKHTCDSEDVKPALGNRSKSGCGSLGHHNCNCSPDSPEEPDELVRSPKPEIGDFKCSLCDFVTGNLLSLKYHATVFHKKKISCDLCSAVMTKHDVILHAMKEHGIDVRQQPAMKHDDPTYGGSECADDVKPDSSSLSETLPEKHKKCFQKKKRSCKNYKAVMRITRQSCRLEHSKKEHDVGIPVGGRTIKQRKRLPAKGSRSSARQSRQRKQSSVLSVSQPTAQKMFNCSLCKYSSLHHQNYQRHVDKFHTLRYPCRQCPASPMTMVELVKHTKDAHGVMKMGGPKSPKELMGNVPEGSQDSSMSRSDSVMQDCQTELIFPLQVSSEAGNIVKNPKFQNPNVVKKAKLENRSVSSKMVLFKKPENKSNIKSKHLQCYSCCYKTKIKSLMSRHVRLHLPEGQFKCPKCDFKENNSAVFARHVQSHSQSEGPTKCCFCSYSAVSMLNFRRHLNKHRSIASFYCSKCEYSTRYSSLLSEHFERFHVKKHSCPECPMSGSKFWVLQHVKKCHPASECKPRRVESKLRTSKSKRNIEKEGIQGSSGLGSDVKKRRNAKEAFRLKIHEDSGKTAKELLHCNLCEYQTVRDDLLQRHKAKHAPLECPVCALEFTTCYSFTVHLTKHNPLESLYKCFYCGHVAKRIGNLEVHLSKHVQALKKHDCSQCEFSCFRPDYLRQHELTHTNKKMFKMSGVLIRDSPESSGIIAKPHFSSKQSVSSAETSSSEAVPNLQKLTNAKLSEKTAFFGEPLQKKVAEGESSSPPKLAGISSSSLELPEAEKNEESVSLGNCTSVGDAPKSSQTKTKTGTSSRQPVSAEHSKSTSEQSFDTVTPPVSVRSIKTKVLKKMGSNTASSKSISPPKAFGIVSLHRKSISTLGLLRCNNCSYKTKMKTLMINHVKLHLPEGQFVCPKCDFKENRTGLFAEHLISHNSPEQVMQCCFCSYSTDTRGNFVQHLNIHRPVGTYYCPKCDFSRATRSVVKSHYLTQHVKKFVCSWCPKVATKFKLAQHFKKWHPSLDSEAHRPLFLQKGSSDCTPPTPNSKSSLKKWPSLNIEVGNGSSGKDLLRCSDCDYQTSRDDLLQRHTAKHVPIVCPICSMGFSKGYSFAAHLSKHNAPGKRYKCVYCTYEGKGVPELYVHLASHLDSLKTLDCPKCEFSCLLRSALEEHMRKHSKKKAVRSEVEPSDEIRPKNSDVNICEPGIDTTHLAVGTSLECSEISSSSVNISRSAAHSVGNRDVATGMEALSLSKCTGMATADGSFPEEPSSVSTCSAHKPRLRCYSCPFTTNLKSLMARHAKLHLPEGQYECSKCDFRSFENLDFAKHIITHSPPGAQLQCCYCSYSTTNMGNFSYHLEVHRFSQHFKKSYPSNHKRKFKSQACSTQETIRKSDLISSIVIKRGNTKTAGDYRIGDNRGEKKRQLLRCKTCEFKTARKSLLLSHEIEHASTHIQEFSMPSASQNAQNRTPDIINKCKIGSVPSESDSVSCLMARSSANKGEMSSRNPHRFQCPDCDFNTLREDLLQRHVPKHNRLVCPVCHSSIISGHSFATHLANHNPASTPFKCHYCDHVPKNITHLFYHLAVHIEALKKYDCSLCEYSVNRPDLLRNHLRSHRSFSYDSPTGGADPKAKRKKLRDHFSGSKNQASSFGDGGELTGAQSSCVSLLPASISGRQAKIVGQTETDKQIDSDLGGCTKLSNAAQTPSSSVVGKPESQTNDNLTETDMDIIVDSDLCVIGTNSSAAWASSAGAATTSEPSSAVLVKPPVNMPSSPHAATSSGPNAEALQARVAPMPLNNVSVSHPTPTPVPVLPTHTMAGSSRELPASTAQSETWRDFTQRFRQNQSIQHITKDTNPSLPQED